MKNGKEVLKTLKVDPAIHTKLKVHVAKKPGTNMVKFVGEAIVEKINNDKK